MTHSKGHDGDDLFGIQQALHAYSGGIDTKDYDLFRSAFSEDGNATFGEVMGPFEGREQMIVFMERLHRDLDWSLHRITNIYAVELTAEAALTRSYVLATLVKSDHPDGDTLEVSGIYMDRLRRDADGWRIAHKDFLMRSISGNPNVLSYEAAAATLA
jgi:ketosteroid isomerase-like protein